MKPPSNSTSNGTAATPSRPRWLVVALILLGQALSGCRQPPAASSAVVVDAVATVGTTAITAAELRAECERRAERGQPTDARTVLDDLVLRETLVTRAQALGLDREPAMIQAWKRLLIAELKRRELEPRLATAATPSEPETATESTSQGVGRKSPRSEIRFAVLRQSFSARSSSSRRQELRARLENARAQAITQSDAPDFGALAAEFSDDQASRYQGGDLGWMPDQPERLKHDPAVLAAARVLRQPGDISPVVQTDNAFYLIRLVGRRVAPLTHIDSTPESRADPRRVRVRRAAIEREFEEAARTAVPITVDTQVLASVANANANRTLDTVPPPSIQPIP